MGGGGRVRRDENGKKDVVARCVDSARKRKIEKNDEESTSGRADVKEN